MRTGSRAPIWNPAPSTFNSQSSPNPSSSPSGRSWTAPRSCCPLFWLLCARRSPSVSQPITGPTIARRGSFPELASQTLQTLTEGGSWQGTATDLVTLLSNLDHELHTNPKALSQAGLHITRSRTANQRMITITLTNSVASEPRLQPAPPSPNPPDLAANVRPPQEGTYNSPRVSMKRRRSRNARYYEQCTGREGVLTRVENTAAAFRCARIRE